MTSKKKAIIAHIFKYASAQYFSQFLGFFTAILLRRFLGPIYMGAYNVLKIVLEYGSYVSIGTDITLCYKLPLLRGQGDEEGAARLKNVIFNFVMAASLLYAMGVLIFAVFSRRSYSHEIFVGLLVVAVLVILQRASSFYITVLRCYKQFSVLSIIIVFEVITNLLLTLFVVGKFKIYGLYCALIVMPVLIVTCIKLLTPQRLKFSFDFKGIMAQIKFGIPLFVKELLNLILTSIDRIMIAGMLGLEYLGFYSIALMVRSYGGDIANNFAVVIQPYFMEAVGKNDRSDTTQRYIVISSQVTAYLMSFILSFIYLAATPFIYYILPKFIPGLTAMRLFLIVTFFITLSGYYYDYLVAINKQLKTIPIAILAIVLSFTLNFLSIKNGYGISGCALSVATATFVSFLLTSIYALKYLKSKKGILRTLAAMFVPFVYSIIVLALITHFIALANLVLESVVRLIIFFISFLPLVYILNKETGIVHFFFALVIDKIKTFKV